MLHDMLESIKSDSDAVPLTPLSTKFLQTAPHQRSHFVAAYRENPLKRQTVITALETLKKSHPDDDAISCLIIGTENKDMYILDPEAFTVLVKQTLPSQPVFLRSTGLYDVDYRILVACRNGNILVMKKGANTPKFCITLNSHPIGIERIGKNIGIATMDKNLMCYNNKIKNLWSIPMPNNITCLASMDFKAKTFKGILKFNWQLFKEIVFEPCHDTTVKLHPWIFWKPIIWPRRPGIYMVWNFIFGNKLVRVSVGS